jgi:hypothetical protein
MRVIAAVSIFHSAPRVIACERGAEEDEIARVKSVRMDTTNLLSKAREASNEDLFAAVERLTLTEHGLLVKVVVLLGEIDRRGIYRGRAWPSLFEYCVAHLKYSEGQACRRIAAARAIQKFPALLAIFERREITLTNLSRVSRALTAENHVELAKAVGTKRRDDAEREIAKWCPQPDMKPLVRQLPTPTLTPKAPERIALPSPPPPPPATVHLPPPPPPPSPGKVKPLSEKRYGAQFPMDEETFRLLEHVKQMTKHRGEAGSLENLMKRAIKLLHEEVEKERLGKVSRPQSKMRPMKDEGAIARSTKREVFTRDGEQCTFRDPMTNRRCPSKTHLELDHIIPRSRGGKGTPENLRLRCRSHNRLAAEESFGAIFIASKIAARKNGALQKDSSHQDLHDLATPRRGLAAHRPGALPPLRGT